MRFRTLATMFVLSLGATNLFAQKGVDDGSKYGHGQDSINCLKNLSIYSEYVKTENYKDAYLPWKAAFEECPKAQLKTYTNGVKIMKWLLANEKDPAKYNKYFDELMKVYDQRIKYFPTYKQTPAPAVLGMKAIDYIQLSKNMDPNQAFTWLKESIDQMKEESEYYVLQFFMDMAAKKYASDPSYKEQFLQDYITVSGYADVALKNEKNPKLQPILKTTKDNIDAIFINSGAADCNTLQGIYADKVEQNKSNLDYLKSVVNVMRLLGCTDSDAYFQASLYAHQLQPTAETAVGCAYMAVKKKDMDGAVKFFDQAIELEQDDAKKAEYAYTAAQVIAATKSYSKARQYAQKAISLNPNFGKPYILIAQLYASSPNWSDEPALNRCTYYLVIDKLQRAKSVDPSVTEEVNKLIGQYAGHTPKVEDLFFLNLKKGDSVTIGGWIGESTVIR